MPTVIAFRGTQPAMSKLNMNSVRKKIVSETSLISPKIGPVEHPKPPTPKKISGGQEFKYKPTPMSGDTEQKGGSSPEKPSQAAKGQKGMTAGSPNKEVKSPEMGKGPAAKNLIPDAKSVKRSEAKAIHGDKHSDPDHCGELLGEPLEGLKKVAKITVDTSGPKTIKAPQPGALVCEGIVRGRTVIRIGETMRLGFDNIQADSLKKIVEGYASVGQKVRIHLRPNVTKTSSIRSVMGPMLESVHMRHLGMHGMREEAIERAKRAVMEALKSEYHSGFCGSRDKWKNTTVKNSFRHAMKLAESIYSSRLKPFDVTVRAKTREGMEDIAVVTSAISEGLAAAAAFKEVLAESGSGTVIRHAFVGTKKFIPEETESLLSKVPDLFSDMPGAQKGNNSGPGTVSDKDHVDADAQEKDLPQEKAHYVGYNGKTTADTVDICCDGGKTGDVGLKDPKVKDGKQDKKIANELEPKKDNGPMFESKRGLKKLSERQLHGMAAEHIGEYMMDLAAKAKSDKLANALSKVGQKVKDGLPLKGNESKILDAAVAIMNGKV